ncbi:hypothetical protein B6E66_01440 [Streptomyces maremycinicus]|nr:hypothetical protein B6E66_01440 [Streptomyces sp. B9173]
MWSVVTDRNPGNGDEVTRSSRGKTVPGRAKKKVTRRIEVAGRIVDAWQDAPRHGVESDVSGRGAVHRPGSLRKNGSGS